MSVLLENGDWRAKGDPTGANLAALFFKDRNLLWDGSAPWPRRGGFNLCFPFFSQPAHAFTHNGATYPIAKHGFARDQVFTVESATNTTITFLLTANEETRRVYPFDFALRAGFHLLPEGLNAFFSVTNTGNEPLPFSLASHPGFTLPKDAPFVRFSTPETGPVFMPDADGFHGPERTSPFAADGTLKLTPALFAKDAVFLPESKSRTVQLCSTPPSKPTLSMSLDGFDALGIWSKPADNSIAFVCFEPIAGLVTADRPAPTAPAEPLAAMQGLRWLAPAQQFSASYKLRLV